MADEKKTNPTNPPGPLHHIDAHLHVDTNPHTDTQTQHVDTPAGHVDGKHHQDAPKGLHIDIPGS
jgi:hypothetical protein